jgi:hypothetical protein
VEAVAWADPLAIEKLKGTPATAVYLSKNGSAAYSMPLYAHKVPALTRDERQAAWASLRMIADAVGELFGPKASIESEEASLLRGPEFHDFAQGIVEALQRVTALSPAPSGGWNDMSSAPKDGTRFLAYEPRGEYRHYECWWQDDFANWAGWQDDWDSEPEPTHWQPLPAAPSQVEG